MKFQEIPPPPKKPEQEILNPIKTVESDENSLEKLEVTIEKIESKEFEIEDKGKEYINKHAGGSSKMEGLLEKLQNKSRTFLKNLSKEVSNYPKEFGYRLHDRRVISKAEKLLKYKDKNFYDLNNKAEKLETFYTNKLQPFLKELQKDTWGNSKLQSRAYERVDELIHSYVHAIDNSFRYTENFNFKDSLLECIKTEGIINKHNSSQEYRGNFSSDIQTTVKYVEHRIDYRDINAESLQEEFKNNPFILATYSENQNLKNKEEFVKKHLYTIAENHPPQSFPWIVRENFNKTSLQFPEELLNDKEKREYFFEVLKNDNLKGGGFTHNFVFEKEQESLTEEDITEILKNVSGYDLKKMDYSVYLASLPLGDKNLKHYFEETDDNKYNREKNYEYTPQEFIGRKEPEHYVETGITRNLYEPFVPFTHHKKFNLSTEERIAYFDEIINKEYGYDRVSSFHNFLGTLMHKYDEVSEGIPPDIFKEKTKEFIRKGLITQNNINAERVHHTFAVLDQYDIFSVEEKKQLFQELVDNIDQSLLDKVFYDQNVSPRGPLSSRKDFSFHEKWLFDREGSKDALEATFYKRGKHQDVRHLFYKVIEGAEVVADKDKLIRSYIERTPFIENEEFISMFFVKKNLGKEYLPLFAKKLATANTKEIFNQLEQLLGLEQITQEEYHECYSALASNAPFHIATHAMGMTINYKKEDGEFLKNQTDSFIKNIILEFNSEDKQRIPENLSLIAFELESIAERNGFENMKSYFLKELLEKSLENENTQKILLALYEEGADFDEQIKSSFPDAENLNKFLDGILQVNNIALNNAILNNFNHHLQNNSYNIDTTSEESETFAQPSYLLMDRLNNEKCRKDFIGHTLSLDNIDLYYTFLQNMKNLTPEENAFLAESIENRGKLRKDLTYNSAEDQFFHLLLDRMVDTPEIFENKAEKIFYGYVIDNELPGSIFENLAQRNSDFFVKYPNSLKEYINYCLEKETFDNYKILTHLYQDKRIHLPEEASKNLFTSYLSHNAFNEFSYRFYKQSLEEDKIFTVTQEQFDKNIELFRDNKHFESMAALGFLREQRLNRNISGVIFCNNEQEKSIVKSIIEKSGIEVLEKLNNFDSELFKSVMKEKLQVTEADDNSLSYNTINAILCHSNFILDGLEKETVDYILDARLLRETEILFEPLCKALKGSNLNSYIKEKVSSFGDENLKRELKRTMLAYDMLGPEELKEIYEEIKENNDIREQVLSISEVLGSLASQKNNVNLLEFLSKNERSAECKQKLEKINHFVNKYSLQEKGRTITTMLFAREYLPDRSLSEVIERVGTQIGKYENILDKYSNQNIPEGVNVSIGMEYEVTHSTASGYKELTERDFKEDIVRLSKAAHIGRGNDAVHEIATRPATNPYLLLLEAQLLHDLEYVDYNFDRSPDYAKGARGYHLTLGGERGLKVDSNVRFLQNVILGASWGGIQAGDTGGRVSGGRGVTVRGRSENDYHNVKIFDKATSSVELRSLSIDKLEQFQRAILASYYGGVAIQVAEKLKISGNPEMLPNIYKDGKNNKDTAMQVLREITNSFETTEAELDIAYAYVELAQDIKDAVDYNNEEFLSGETGGYLDKETYIDIDEFGGRDNRKRFESVVSSIDETMSVEEYSNNLKINWNDLFGDFKVELSDTFTKLNNLYLKPSNALGKGDQANAKSMLEVTKFSNTNLERRDDPAYLTSTVFNTLGEKREGYYAVQGASEKMLTHAFQIALLKFTNSMEDILNRK